MALAALLLGLMPSAQAAQTCPDVNKKTSAFLVVAHGTVGSEIEPDPVLGCIKHSIFQQCVTPLSALPTPRSRFNFRVDEYYYVSPTYLTNIPYHAGDKAQSLGLPKQIIIITGQQYAGKEGLLVSTEVNDYGDFRTDGCNRFVEKSLPDYEPLLKDVKKLHE
jgi:hypothetical protein